MTTVRVQQTPATTTFLRSVPVFGGLEGARLTQLYSLLEEQRWKKGDHLFNEAELGRTMYVLREGEVDVVRRAASGNPVQIVTLGPGETFGEMTLVELQPRSASVLARSGAVTYSLTNLDLYRLYEKDSYAYTLILQNICRMLSRRLRKADSRIAEFLDAALAGEAEASAELRSASKPHRAKSGKKGRQEGPREEAPLERVFTGLIQDVGTVKRVSRGAMTDLWLESAFPTGEYKLGESIACDGCCLTVVEFSGSTFKVQASPETLRCTTLGNWNPGTRVNLEKALRMGDRMGGHWVQGHVDGVARLVERRTEGGTTVMGFSFAPELDRFFIEKGSVTVDGVSLTVNRLDAARFFVALIPETLERTTLGGKQVGATVNLETDLVGKYVAKLVPAR